MSDLVEVIWGGPFEAHVGYPPRTVQHGERLEVTARQAEENPDWYQPIPAEAPEKPAPSVKPAPAPTADPEPQGAAV